MISLANINNTQEKFSLETFKSTFVPDEICNFNLSSELYQQKRLNHYLIKQPNDNCLYVNGLHNNLISFINTCLNKALSNIPDTSKRYVYLTFDNANVKANKSQRDYGWHVDGLQGDEVSEKVNNCFQFICFNKLPTIFTKQTFNLDNYNISKDNIFSALGDQVKNVNTYNTKSNTLYFMNPYMVHSSSKANSNCKRLFLRLYFSHLPITSKKATINPYIDYNFKPHTTSGNIPNHLK